VAPSAARKLLSRKVKFSQPHRGIDAIADAAGLWYHGSMAAASHWRTVLGSVGAALCCALLLGACSMAGLPKFKASAAKTEAAGAAGTAVASSSAEVEERFATPLAFADPTSRVSRLDGLIAKYAAYHDIPESLLRRVIERESGYNPAARNGPYYGLMQIRHDTARTMGYRGDAAGLLDAETNLKYAGKYLRGAYMVGGYSQDAAVRHYSSGYYYHAKRQGLLEETGLR
jgi:soluble lytic murein transglycosylase-like protein